MGKNYGRFLTFAKYIQTIKKLWNVIFSTCVVIFCFSVSIYSSMFYTTLFFFVWALMTPRIPRDLRANGFNLKKGIFIPLSRTLLCVSKLCCCSNAIYKNKCIQQIQHIHEEKRFPPRLQTVWWNQKYLHLIHLQVFQRNSCFENKCQEYVKIFTQYNFKEKSLFNPWHFDPRWRKWKNVPKPR